MTKEECLKYYEINGRVLHIRYMVDLLTKGAQMTPIEKGVLGNYKCKQDIIERDRNLLENLECIQRHLHRLCDDMEKIVLETKTET